VLDGTRQDRVAQIYLTNKGDYVEQSEARIQVLGLSGEPAGTRTQGPRLKSTTISNEWPLSGAERAVATVARWPMAVLNQNLPLEKNLQICRKQTFNV